AAVRNFDYGVRLWDTATGRPLAGSFQHPRQISTGSVFLQDGKQLATGCRDGVVRFWNTTTGRLARTLRAPGASDVRGHRAASADGRRLLETWDGGAAVWDLPSGRLVRLTSIPLGAVFDAGISPDG